MYSIARAVLVTACLLCGVTPGLAQSPDASERIVIAALSHLPRVTPNPVPDGRVAVDSTNFEPRRHLDAVAQALDATVTTQGKLCEERLPRGRCDLRASGHSAIVRARSLVMEGDGARVVADIRWDIRVGIQYLQVALDLVQENGEWEIVDSTVLFEGDG